MGAGGGRGEKKREGGKKRKNLRAPLPEGRQGVGGGGKGREGEANPLLCLFHFSLFLFLEKVIFYLKPNCRVPIISNLEG